MTCVPFQFGDTVAIVNLGGPVYKFEGYLFEWDDYGGPIELDEDWDCKMKSSASFYQMIDRFEELTPEEKEKHWVD